MTTVELKLNVSDEVLEYLQREAGTRKVSLDIVVSDVLADYFDEPSKEEILASIKRGMQQALRGEGRPALEFLDELDEDAD
jgi:hypothetical protein